MIGSGEDMLAWLCVDQVQGDIASDGAPSTHVDAGGGISLHFFDVAGLVEGDRFTLSLRKDGGRNPNVSTIGLLFDATTDAGAGTASYGTFTQCDVDIRGTGTTYGTDSGPTDTGDDTRYTGCGCRTGGAPAGSWPFVALLGLCLPGTRRRR